ncbi:MAG: hypothetical protein LLG14_18210 [Nocardiaceae bacterium]|nr:hypothetical protein [Nocardiaceae bacterium]
MPVSRKTKMLQGRMANASRFNGADSPAAQDARREWTAARIEEYVAEVVRQAPPLTPAQRQRIVDIMRNPGRDLGGDAA